MKIKRSNSHRTKLLVLVLIALLIVIGVAIYWKLAILDTQPKHLKNINYNPPTSDQKRAGNEAKQRAIERGSTNNQNNKTAKSDAELISFKSSVDKDNQQLVVQTTLDNSVSWDKCFLALTQGSATKSYEAPVIYQSDASFCGGFSVPIKDMNRTWTIKLKVTEINGTTHEVDGSIQIN